MRKGFGDRRQTRSRRVQAEPDLEYRLSAQEVAGTAKAKRKAAEHDRSHQADPLDRGQGGVKFFLDRRERDADAADTLNVEKSSETNDEENA